jgi:hypothetical protein
MSELPNTIITVIKFLVQNGYNIRDEITILKKPYIYDPNIIKPTEHDICRLEHNINRYAFIKFDFNTPYFMDYWNDHNNFINTFKKENILYESFGYDSWIHHFIKNIKFDEKIKSLQVLDKSFLYPLIIGFEVNQDLPICSVTIETLQKGKDFIKNYINKNNYKWGVDTNKIKSIVDSLNNNDHESDDNTIKSDLKDMCFCKSGFIKQKIYNETHSYDNNYSDYKLDIIHAKYCSLHLLYLLKNIIEQDRFIKYGYDKWINFIELADPSFNSLVKNDPQYYYLDLFNLINITLPCD